MYLLSFRLLEILHYLCTEHKPFIEMKIAIIGYGKMGKMIEQIARAAAMRLYA